VSSRPLPRCSKVFAARQIRNRATWAEISPRRPRLATPPRPPVAGRGAGPGLGRREPDGRPCGLLHGVPKDPAWAREIILEIALPRFEPGRASCAGRTSSGVQAARARHQHRPPPRSRSTPTPQAWFAGPGWPTGVSRPPRPRARRRGRLEGRRLPRPPGGREAPRWRVQADRRRARSAEYRRGLVVGLWEKFASGATSAARTARSTLPRAGRGRPGPSKALRHESAVGHVTGRALYADDTAQRRPMLDLWPVCSPMRTHA